jgi:hypothetical protein
MMKATSTSETSVGFYEATQYNLPEDNLFHIRRRENMKPRRELICLLIT